MRRRHENAHFPLMAVTLLAALGPSACIPGFEVAPTGGAGGSGGGGIGGEVACEPESEIACYTGIPGTEGLGLCTLGTQVCNAQGQVGACAGSGAPKAEDCSSAEDENCDGKPGCAGECLWTRHFEKGHYSTGGDWTKAGNGGVAVDEQWNTIVVGSYDGFNFSSGPPDFGAGPLSCASSRCGFFAKFDPLGNHVWSASMEAYTGEAVAVLSSGDIVVVGQGGGPESFVCGAGGATSYGVIIAVLDPDGNCKPGWPAMKLDVKPASPPRLAVDKEGAIYLAYDAEGGSIDGTSYSNRPILVRIEPDGKLGWVEEFGGLGARPVALAVGSEGDVYLVGDKWDKAEFGKLTLPASYEDVFVAKFRPGDRGTVNGPWNWAMQMNAEYKSAHAGDIVIGSNDTVFVTGATSTTIAPNGCSPLEPGGLFIAQLNPWNGSCQRARSLGQVGASDVEVNQHFHMRLDPGARHLVLTGLYEDASQLFPGGPWESVPIATDGNMFVAKLEIAAADDAFKPVWIRGFGGQSADLPYGLAVDSGGSPRLSGAAVGADFGCGEPDNAGANFFVTRLSP